MSTRLQNNLTFFKKLYLIFAINAVYGVNNGNISVFVSKWVKIVFFIIFFPMGIKESYLETYSKYFLFKVSLWLDTSLTDFVEIAFQWRTCLWINTSQMRFSEIWLYICLYTSEYNSTFSWKISVPLHKLFDEKG